MPSFVFLISKSVGELSQKSRQDAFISFKYQNLSVNCLKNRVGEFCQKPSYVFLISKSVGELSSKY